MRNKNSKKILQSEASGEDGSRQFLSGFEDPGCPEGVPVEFALLSILGAFGVAFGVNHSFWKLTEAFLVELAFLYISYFFPCQHVKRFF